MKAAARLLFVLVVLSAIAATSVFAKPHRHSKAHKSGAAANADVSVRVDAQSPTGHSVSTTLWGIFFEEINHAGVGGLDAQLLKSPTFVDGSETNAWVAQGLTTSLDTAHPLAALNQSLSVKGVGSLTNAGFWGVPIVAGESYELSLFVLVPVGGSTGALSASLLSASGAVVAKVAIPAVAADGKWHQLSAVITVPASAANDYKGSFALVTASNAQFSLQLVTLYPASAGFKGLDFIRTDIAEYIAAMKPSFMRFPGGCFVEGNVLSEAFRWKKSIGALENRPGHHDLWGYWTPDHLGYLEFLEFAEALGTEPMYVVNNGESHNEAVKPEDLAEWVQDALDALEFANGNVNTTWGALRAQYGHPEPFNMKYMAIGNEDEGKKYYWENYQLFRAALLKAMPSIKLVSNGQPSKYQVPAANASMWDYHYYGDVAGMFAHATAFDSYSRQETPVFVSEYAVTTGSGKRGNFVAALAEAAFLTGVERNSDIVRMISYAPLLVNENDRKWSPDAIVYDNHQLFGTPSYWLQTMFGNGFTSENIINTAISSSREAANGVSYYVSVTGPNLAHSGGDLVVKFVSNSSASSVTVNVLVMLPTSVPLPATAKMVQLSGGLSDENSFEQPTLVVPKTSTVPLQAGPDGSFNLVVPGFSVTTLVLSLKMGV